MIGPRSRAAATEGMRVTNDNPYKAPTTPLKDAPRPPHSPIIAVLAGLAVDIGGSLLASILIGIAYAAILASQGMSPEEIGATLTEPDPSTRYFVFSVVVGLGFSLLGGYVCARIARRQERRWATILGLLSGVIGLSMVSDRLEIGVNLGLSLLSIAIVVLGGELGRRRNVAIARAAGAVSAA